MDNLVDRREKSVWEGFFMRRCAPHWRTPGEGSAEIFQRKISATRALRFYTRSVNFCKALDVRNENLRISRPAGRDGALALDPTAF